MSTASPALARLAHLLGVAVEELHDLAGVADHELRALHDQVSQRLFVAEQHRFERIAGLSARLPGPMAAKLAESFLPPAVAARVAELLAPERARDLVGRLSLGYLSDVAVALDPRRSRAVVQAIAPERVAAVARELLARRQHLLLVDFLGAVTVASFAAVLDAAEIEDLVALLPLVECDEATTAAFRAASSAARAGIEARLDELPPGTAPALRAALAG